jgi:hypothetical protein
MASDLFFLYEKCIKLNINIKSSGGGGSNQGKRTRLGNGFVRDPNPRVIRGCSAIFRAMVWRGMRGFAVPCIFAPASVFIRAWARVFRVSPLSALRYSGREARPFTLVSTNTIPTNGLFWVSFPISEISKYTRAGASEPGRLPVGTCLCIPVMGSANMYL